MIKSHPYQFQSSAETEHQLASNDVTSPAGLSTQLRPSKASKSSRSTLLSSGTNSTSSSRPVSAHLRSELFDAIVQAADPRHPDHAAWQDRYGALSSTSSRASVASSHKREKPSAPSASAPLSTRQSFDHSELSARRKTPSRRSGIRDLPSRATQDALGSDADDPATNEAPYSSLRASFEGSVRSYQSPSVASSSHRRRNRRLRDAPKPLVPPIPPPRITSSPNWQTTFGSPSLPELTSSSTPRAPAHPSSSNTSDHQDRAYLHARPQRLLASPPPPSSLRMPHPYASALTFAKEHEPDLEPRTSLSAVDSAYTFPTSARSPPQNSTFTSNLSNRTAQAIIQEPEPHGNSHLQSPRQSAPILATSSSSALQNTILHTPDGVHSSDYSAAPRKSTSKIRKLLGSAAPTLAASSFPDKARLPAQADSEAYPPPSRQKSAPAVPPKDFARNGHQTSASLSRAPVSAFQSPVAETKATRQSHDAARTVDLDIFPMCRDDEFRTNEFEMDSTEDMDADTELLAAHMSPPSFRYTSSTPAARSGVMRRSLDSIISPFRAGLLNGKPSATSATAAPTASSNLSVPIHEPIAEGRRSFSDSRFGRSFLPRHRPATFARQARPLSKVVDHPDNEVGEVPSTVDLTQGSNHPDAASDAHLQFEMQDMAPKISDRATITGIKRPDMSTKTAGSRSLVSTYSRSTSNLRDLSHTSHSSPVSQHRPRGKFGGLLIRVKGSVTPKGLNLATSPPNSSPSAPSRSAEAFDLNFPMSEQAASMSASPSFSGNFSNGFMSKKVERSFRARVKSLTALSSSRSKEEIDNVPPVPAIPVAFAAPEDVVTRSIWEESPQLPTSSQFPSEKSSRNLGRLLRRKKMQQHPITAVDVFVPTTPKRSSPHVVEESAPRSSTSSARGFDVVEQSGDPANIAQSRITIRKTLSPALLSDTPQTGIEAGLVTEQLRHFDADVISTGNGGTADTETALLSPSTDDSAELGVEVEGDEQRFRSPLGRFIRGQPRVDRLSRVEELSERLSWIAEPNESKGVRPSASVPLSGTSNRSSRSFAEHRLVRTSTSGNLRVQTLPSTLELAVTKDSRTRKVSLDMLRPSKKQSSLSHQDATTSMPSSILSSPAAANLLSTPKGSATPALREQLTPSWRSTSFSAQRSARTSFSQDRDRAPVASPFSPPLPSSRGVGQAFKRLGIKGKNNKGGKGIGPADLIVVDLGDDTNLDQSWRPSMSVESRPSFGAEARPSFSSMLRPTFGGGRPSFDATARSDVESNGLIPSPVTPSFGSHGLSQKLSKETSKSTASLQTALADGDGRLAANGSQVAGLGINSLTWAEAIPSQKGENVDLSGSTSDGTFTTHGIQTPENGSVSHSYISQMPSRTDLTGATTPLAGRASMDSASQPTPPTVKSSELLALEAMLGRFPQQEKVLLQDISARVAQSADAKAGGAA